MFGEIKLYVKENWWAKYCTDWLRSKYNWRHSNDVSVVKIPMYVPNWIPYKTYISKFPYLKINRMMSLCNLFLEWASY